MKLKVVFTIALTANFAFGQSNCTAFPQYITPSLPSYISAMRGAIASMQAQISVAPQPAIPLAGQNVMAVQGTLGSDFGAPTGATSCQPYFPAWDYSPYLQVFSISGAMDYLCPFANYKVQRGYIEALYAAGVRVLDINLGMLPLVSSSEYQYYCSHYSSIGIGPGCPSVGTPASTCYGGAGMTIPGAATYGDSGPAWSTPPSNGGTGYHFGCAELAVIDDLIWYAAVHKQMKVIPALNRGVVERDVTLLKIRLGGIGRKAAGASRT